jgi:uncharacterized protein YjbI with pentapeptide repeats
MANNEYIALLKLGVEAWNARRAEGRDLCPDLSEAELPGANLHGANLQSADLRQANLIGAKLDAANLSFAKLDTANLARASLLGANLNGASLSTADLRQSDLNGANLYAANFTGANLSGLDLTEANLSGAKLDQANLSGAKLDRANLGGAKLGGANLTSASLGGAHLSAYLFRANLEHAYLNGANLYNANLCGACLKGASLEQANLFCADLSDADLSGADLDSAILVRADLENADLTGCRVFGVSAWGLNLKKTKQQDLVITNRYEPTVTVDNIEVAQFIYLLLHNEKIRDVIDTVGKKGVLLLGRFNEHRIEILERLRDELRKRGYLPIIFNFDKPETKNFTETVRLLAGLSHFVIADVTNPKSAPLELQATVPEVMVPFRPIIQEGEKPFAMLEDLWIQHRDWVFEPLYYSSVDALVAALDEKIIKPSRVRAAELLARKAEKMRGEHV